MRRRWKLLVAVGAVALFAGLVLLLPPRDDGLDWVRKYGVSEKSGRGIGVKGQIVWLCHFNWDVLPVGLDKEVRNRVAPFIPKDTGNYSGKTHHGWKVLFSRSTKQMFATREASWLEQRLKDVRTWVGWK
jgi:hypothetical protein